MIGEEAEEEKEQEQKKYAEEENKGSSKSLNFHAHMIDPLFSFTEAEYTGENLRREKGELRETCEGIENSPTKRNESDSSDCILDGSIL
jgi:hypothetical protein